MRGVPDVLPALRKALEIIESWKPNVVISVDNHAVKDRIQAHYKAKPVSN